MNEHLWFDVIVVCVLPPMLFIAWITLPRNWF